MNPYTASEINSPPVAPPRTRRGGSPRAGNAVAQKLRSVRRWLAEPAPGGVSNGVWVIIAAASLLVGAGTYYKKKRDDSPGAHFKEAGRDAAASAREAKAAAKETGKGMKKGAEAGVDRARSTAKKWF